MRRLPFRHPDHLPGAFAGVGETVADSGVVLLPTETFYGLAVAVDDPVAVERVFELKARPRGMSLPVLCCDWVQAESLVEIPGAHRDRLSQLWPGALTVILPARRPLACAGGGTLAVRIPDHALVRALLHRLGPLTATSANRHGDPPPRGWRRPSAPWTDPPT